MLFPKTTCTVTGRFYLGMHSTHELDDGYLGSGLLLQRSIKIHGIEAHVREILEFAQSRESLSELEKSLITEHVLQDPLCMNIKLGGEGGWKNVNQWPETRPRSMTEEQKEQIRETLRGRKLSDETKKKIGDSHRGMKKVPHTEETKRKIREGNLKMTGERNGFFGKKHSEETEAKMRAAREARALRKQAAS